MSEWFERVLDVNRDVARSIGNRLSYTKVNPWDEYLDRVQAAMADPGVRVVVDVGTGAVSRVACRKPPTDVRIIGVDRTHESMVGNDDVDEKRVADVVAQGLPFSDGEVDLVTSVSVLEHLANVPQFVRESKRVLRRGGYFIHLFPCRYSSFATLNRLLPTAVSGRLLDTLHPACKGQCGYPTYYDWCYPSAAQSLLIAGGFSDIAICVSFYGSSYYEIFLPAFALSILYETIVSKLGATNLSAYVIVSARA